MKDDNLKLGAQGKGKHQGKGKGKYQGKGKRQGRGKGKGRGKTINYYLPKDNLDKNCKFRKQMANKDNLQKNDPEQQFANCKWQSPYWHAKCCLK